MTGRRILWCVLEGMLTGLLLGFIDGLTKSAKAEIRRASKEHAVPFNRLDLDLN